MTVGFTSCNKDDDPFKDLVSGAFDGVITAQVENGNAYNNLVKRVGIGTWEGWNQEQGIDIFTVFASAPYANGGFTLTLPQTVEAEFLSPWDDDDDEFYSDLKISDKNAQIMGMAEFGAYSSTSSDFDDYDRVGWIHFGKEEFDGNYGTGTGTYNYARALFVYADRDVAMVGTVTWSDTWDGVTYTQIEKHSVSLKKGWNIMYFTQSENYVNGERQGTTEEIHITTATPSGLKWLGNIYGPYGSPAKQAKSVRERGHKRFARLGR